MSGIVITADFNPGSEIVGFTPPVNGPWNYINFFDNGTLSLNRNLANGNPGTFTVGAPIRNPHTTQFKTGFNFLETGIYQSTRQTSVVIARPIERPNSFALSNFLSDRGEGNTGKSVGYSVWFQEGTSPTLYKPQIIVSRKVEPSGGALSDASNLPEVAVSGAIFGCYLARYDSVSGAQSIWNMSNGQKASTTLGANPDLGAEPLRIGSNKNPPYDAATAGSSEVASVWNRSDWMTDSDANTLYQWLKAYYARRGISI